MDFLMFIIVTVSLISVESARPTKVKRRLNVLESRVTALESRVSLESTNTQEIADKVSVMNTTLEDLESVCHASNHPIKQTVDTDKRRPVSFLETEARVLTAFKEEKDDIRNTVNEIGNTLSEIQQNMSRKVEFEMHAMIDNYNELKITVENINMSLLEKQEELSSKIEKLSSELKQDIKLSEELKDFVKEQINDLKINMGNKFELLHKCDDLWSRYEMFCYRYFNVPVNYTEAKQKCASSGAVVVDLQSQAEVDFVQGLTGHVRFWIGLTDIEEEGTWIWKRTKSTASFLNWRPGQPDSFGGNQDCAIAGYTSPYDKWNDFSCNPSSHTTHYVCKKSV